MEARAAGARLADGHAIIELLMRVDARLEQLVDHFGIEEEEEEDEQPRGIVATPAMASPVSARATPVSATDDDTAPATPRVATAVADALETAEAELEETETPTP